MNNRLIVCIVPHGRGDLVAGAARDAGAGGGTILMGRGTAASGILQLLGLGDTSKELTVNVVSAVVEPGVKEAIRLAAFGERRHFGVMFTVDVADFLRSGDAASASKGAEAMEKSEYQLISVIVNKGYAEDAMAAARKAGASGGTILGARGTASEADARFFGVKLVPEKELLLILAPVAVAEAVFQAVRALPCFAEKGSGIEFSVPVRDFTALGR
ncbi:MAG: transcriptional regulator [Kiritimatiellae bacterium]|nr:transcriptional regulator [Kiritimatiellia bacterium]